MRRTQFIIILSTCFLSFALIQFLNGQNLGHNIKFKVNGLENDYCYIAHHFSDKKYIKDTVWVNSNGIGVYKGKSKLPGGVYLFVLPSKQNYFEFLINKDQHFTLETNRQNLVNNMKVTGSYDNEVFFDYIRFLNKYQGEAPKKVRNKKEEVLEKHSESFYAYILEMMQNPDYPEIKGEDGKIDSMQSFLVYRKRFLEKMNWSDERLLRSPVYHNKMTTYLNDLTAGNPDSIIKAAEKLVSRTDKSNGTFKHVVNHITNKYEKSNVMGMDKVFVHMAEQYYLTGMADWVSDKEMKEIRKRVKRIRPNLIGKQAPRLTMEDIYGNPQQLYGIDESVKVLFFWDTDCRPCKSEIMKLKKIYKNYHERGLEIFAVYTEDQEKRWKNFVNQKELPWINVYDPHNSSKFRSYYDVYNTPVIYVLDQDNKIQAKRIDVEKLYDIIPELLNETEKSSASTEEKNTKDEKDKSNFTSSSNTKPLKVDHNIPDFSGTQKHTYALIIGNQNYTDYQNSLTREQNVPFAKRDARIFAKYCRKTLGVPEDNIRLDTNATKGQMQRHIDWLVKLSKYGGPKTKLIFYYSGHGFPDRETKKKYLMPVDISGGQVKQGIYVSSLYDKLLKHDPKRATVFLDACFSGSGRGNKGLLAAKSVKIEPKDNAIMNGNLVAFSSSQGDQRSYFYREKKHGMFTYFLLKKLQQTQGGVTYGALKGYLTKKVPIKSITLHNDEQVPEVSFSREVKREWKEWQLK